MPVRNWAFHRGGNSTSPPFQVHQRVRPYTGNIWGYPASFPMLIEAPQVQEVHATGLVPFLRRSIVEYNLSPITSSCYYLL